MSEPPLPPGGLPPRETHPNRERALLGMMIAAAVIGTAILSWRDPTTPGFYPPCPFHRLTGLYCPGCGSTRATHALLHGHLGQALAYNLAMVAALPFLGYALVRHVRRVVLGLRRRDSRRLPPGLILMIAAALSLFWVLRNLPYPPFTLLAPHVLPR
jgi:hypothetical protein